MSEWKKVKFLDVVHLNPRISLEKGVEYPFVEMSNVVPCARKPEKDVFKKYLGEGTKFEQGDTIVARIEPCLQNGKGFQCSYKQGFGSTEFLVFRPVNINDLDCDFLYYYMGQQSIREAMAKTMVGASGRQRVNNKVFNDLQINLPPLSTQHRIANILSRYDSLIENYQKQIKLLEEAAQRLYKEWFIDLHFPGHENTNIIDGLPEGWEMKKVGEIAIISAGGDKPDVVTEEQTTECQVPIYSNGTTKEGLYGYTNKSSNTAGSITVSARGSIGFACLRMHDYFSIVRLISIKPQNNVDLMYLFQFTKVHTFMSNGAAQQQLTVPMVKAIDVVYPAESLLEAFENVVLPLYKKVQSLQSQLRLLTEARDRLLPKLMSGEITV